MRLLLSCAVSTITFDDPSIYSFVRPTDISGQVKEGFIWQSAYLIVPFSGAGNPNACTLGNQPTTNGYANAVVSQPQALAFFVGTTGYPQGYVCASPSSKAFIPQTVAATAAWKDGMTLSLTGHGATGNAISSHTTTINYGAPTIVDLTTLGQIYAMSFNATGGTPACRDYSPGTEMSFDNFVAISKSNTSAHGCSWMFSGHPCDYNVA